MANLKANQAKGGKVMKADPSIVSISERDVTRGFNGKSLWMKQPISPNADEFQVWPASSRPNWFQMSAYLASVGLHVPDPRGGEDVRKVQSMFQLSKLDQPLVVRTRAQDRGHRWIDVCDSEGKPELHSSARLLYR